MHLAAERLAEAVEGGLTRAEREHMAGCLACTQELEAMRAVVRLAGDERRRIAPPLTQWESLAGRLRREGLSSATPAARARRDLRRWRVLGARAAVAVLLVGSGVVLGRATVPTVRDGGAVSDAAAAAGEVALPRATFASPDEAYAALQRATRDYDLASTWLAAHDTVAAEADPDQYRTRLAALDRTAETMQQAMRDAPADPFLTEYYRATLNARAHTLRRLGTVLPVGSRLGRF